MDAPLVTILCRPPWAPDCKTRLAAELGRERAAALYRRCLTGVLAAASKLGTQVRVAVAGRPLAVADICETVAPQAELVRQRGESFAARQRHEIASGLADGHDAVALIASDLPALDERAVAWALAGAEEAGVGIVPSPDGGYSILAASRDLPELAEVPMSRGDTLDALLQALREHGVEPRVARFAIQDLDEARDLPGAAT
jgi:glycosyltransferase A (GT-A) superfamily protein (DUF2064 family)